MLRKIIFSIMPMLIVACLINYWLETSCTTSENMRKRIKLMIGITSRPDHFEERTSLRETWLQPYQNNFHYKFLVGSKHCHIHPSDRAFSSSCEYLNISIPDDSSTMTQFMVGSKNPVLTVNKTFNAIGFSFYVNFKIEVNSLGLLKSLKLNTDTDIARVILKDLKSSNKIKSVSFHGGSIPFYLEKDGYIVKKLDEAVSLPRGFEGSVVVEGTWNDDNPCSTTTSWTHNNFITIYNIITHNGTRVTDDTCTCMFSTFGFVIKDLDHLKKHNETKSLRAIEWSAHTRELNRKLDQESKEYGDLLLMNMLDIYHNLPKKILLFLDWLLHFYDPDFMLKTDDDTFIDMMKVLSELNSTCEWDMWSCFRENWPVHRQGRHREVSFPRDVYPTFPSGAGYVLSQRALTWLQPRLSELRSDYAGEDVAVGIWLEGMNPRRHFGKTCHWACNHHCHHNTCNVMQLSVSELYTVFGGYRECGNNICLCPARAGGS